MQGANLQLRQRLQESLAELHVAHEQLAILQQLQQQLEEDVPGAGALVDAALAQERALQDARNERVLQMLKSKVGAPWLPGFHDALVSFTGSCHLLVPQAASRSICGKESRALKGRHHP